MVEAHHGIYFFFMHYPNNLPKLCKHQRQKHRYLKILTFKAKSYQSHTQQAVKRVKYININTVLTNRLNKYCMDLKHNIDHYEYTHP